MKKYFLISFLLFSALSVAACVRDGKESSGGEIPEQSGGENENKPDVPTSGANGRYLVVYSSRTGNTERVAGQIRAALDCDVLEIEPSVAYDDDYNAMTERARAELASIRRGDFPAVKTSVGSFDDYDMIFVGYPIWYGSMATPMQAFLHENASKLAGKRIALFATSGGSGISASVGEARRLCPGVTVIDRTLLLTSSTLSQMENRVKEWLDGIGVERTETETSGKSSLNVNITVGDRTVTATMEDNAAAWDFLSRLPLEVTLEDYNRTTEKGFYPTPALTIRGVARGCAPSPGDMTVYAPWGNVAIFCKSWPQSDDLIKIGRIDGDGIEALSVAGDIRVKFEQAIER